MSWPLLIIEILAGAAVIVLLARRNLKDKKKFEKEMNLTSTRHSHKDNVDDDVDSGTADS